MLDKVMSQKAIKKIRRWYNKDIRASILAQQHAMLKIFKPRPWWFPKWLWRRAIKFFLDI